MPILLKNAEVYAPEPIGRRQVLIAGNRISRVGDDIDLHGAALEVIDAEGTWLLPGFVDPLTHPCGGGGEGGFGNRTGEVGFEAFVRAGVTTPVGALGTDSITRSLEVLYGSVMGLRSRGLAAFMYSGSYRVPPETLTGDLARDMVLVDPVLGVGEVAISDHRSSQPTAGELRRLAADVHLGGVLSGKRGTVFVHVGDGDSGLDPIEAALAGSELPRRLFYPTHVNRKRALFEQAIEFTAGGGYADITASSTPEFVAAGEVPALEALGEALEAGAPAERWTFSSDAGGSMPLYRDGALVGLLEAGPGALLEVLNDAIGAQPALVPAVIAALTRNPARALGLASKGRIGAGQDADLLLFDPGTGRLRDVFCGGHRLMREGEIAPLSG